MKSRTACLACKAHGFTRYGHIGTQTSRAHSHSDARAGLGLGARIAEGDAGQEGSGQHSTSTVMPSS